MRVTVFLSCLFLLLSSCTGIFRENGGSGVFLELPAWPPQDALEENYPPITGWNITVHYGSCFRIYSVPADSTHVQIEPWRGLPVAVTAEPAAANGLEIPLTPVLGSRAARSFRTTPALRGREDLQRIPL